MQTETPTPYPDDEIDLRQLAATLWDGRWWIIASIFICSVIAVANALLATPIYRAETLVQIRQESRTGGGLNALAAQFGGLADFAGLAGGNDARTRRGSWRFRTLQSRHNIGVY